MATENKVYLDHLVQRESLRYRRSEEEVGPYPLDKQATLRLSDLTSDQRGKYLRKPDFQRATWAWTPEECVSLLESIINSQVIPSIIMWTSPQNGYDYILDGGHRVSVVLAWLKDDWGERYATENIDDEEQLGIIQRANRQARQSVKMKIGDIQTYKLAEEEMTRVVKDGKSPREELDDVTFRKGLFYQSLLKGDVSFHVLWVRGDYKTAEQSFLKINKSGRQLSDWETTLVENRNSSFARSVMSISSGSTAPHYWPEDAPNGLSQTVEEITESVKYLQNVLFQPQYHIPINRLQQPFMVASIPDRPRYIAELLTVTEGYRGQEPETQKLLKKDPDADPEQIITDGWHIIHKAVDIFEHLHGPSNQSKSLALVPALYFYNDAGRYVRSLLYGFIYWMFMGTEAEILDRKRFFTIYRAAFEQIIRINKSEIISVISRKTGSGPEVTVQTARFYHDVLMLLIKHDGDTDAGQFVNEYEFLMSGTVRQDPSRTTSLRSRSFTEPQKSAALLSRILDQPIRCDICGGMIDPQGSIQHDHIIPYSQGGLTTPSNQSVTHPFCNHQRASIEGYINKSYGMQLPRFSDSDELGGPKQLLLFPDSAFE